MTNHEILVIGFVAWLLIALYDGNEAPESESLFVVLVYRAIGSIIPAGLLMAVVWSVNKFIP
jgi:uncharacterized membrane protein YbhN (UPF0104 family)